MTKTTCGAPAETRSNPGISPFGPRLSPRLDRESHRVSGTEDRMPKRELIDIAAEVRGETDRAWRLFDGTKTEWVPKSQVEQNEDGTFTMPEWLAKDKGFI